MASGRAAKERNLSGCRLLPCCEVSEQIDNHPLGFPGLRAEEREGRPEVGAAVEVRAGIDFSCEESLTQRTPWNKADPKFLGGWQHFRFRISRPQRVRTSVTSALHRDFYRQ